MVKSNTLYAMVKSYIKSSYYINVSRETPYSNLIIHKNVSRETPYPNHIIHRNVSRETSYSKIFNNLCCKKNILLYVVFLFFPYYDILLHGRIYSINDCFFAPRMAHL